MAWLNSRAASAYLGLVRVETAQPAVSRPIFGTDLNGKPVRLFGFG